ncbi:MAG: hypothetical protein ABJZ55_01090 [Fuerstiella sp.]
MKFTSPKESLTPLRQLLNLLDDLAHLAELGHRPSAAVFPELQRAITGLNPRSKAQSQLLAVSKQLEDAFANRLFSFSRTPIRRLRDLAYQAARDESLLRLILGE